MSTDFQNKIDIEPILKEVNDVVKKGLNKVLYDYTVQKLSSELDKCRKEMELYKKELEEARKYYQQNHSEISYIEDREEHILLNIEDISDNESEISIEQILEKGKINTTNMQIKTNLHDINECGEEEDASEADEEEEQDTSEAEEEEEEQDTSEAEEEEEEEDASEAEEEEEAVVSIQAVNIEDEDDDIETEEENEEEVEVEEAEEEVFEIEIADVTYFATNEENGPFYEVDESGDPGKEAGYLKHGEPFFFSDAAK